MKLASITGAATEPTVKDDPGLGLTAAFMQKATEVSQRQQPDEKPLLTLNGSSHLTHALIIPSFRSIVTLPFSRPNRVSASFTNEVPITVLVQNSSTREKGKRLLLGRVRLYPASLASEAIIFLLNSQAITVIFTLLLSIGVFGLNFKVTLSDPPEEKGISLPRT